MGFYLHKNILQDTNLTSNQKLIYAYLVATRQQELNITNQEIANNTGFTRKEIEWILPKLIKAGYIKTQGKTRTRTIKICKYPKIDFAKGKFNGFQIETDILNLKIGATQKILLAEIKSLLLTKKGECTASNFHFAKNLCLSERAVKYLLFQLKQKNLLKIVKDTDKNNKTGRKIFIKDSTIAPIQTTPAPQDLPPKKDDGDNKHENENNNASTPIKPANPPQKELKQAVKDILAMYPNRPDMDEAKIKKQHNLAIPILEKMDVEELNKTKFIISYNLKYFSQWQVENYKFVPLLYTFLTKDQKKYWSTDAITRYKNDQNRINNNKCIVFTCINLYKDTIEQLLKNNLDNAVNFINELDITKLCNIKDQNFIAKVKQDYIKNKLPLLAIKKEDEQENLNTVGKKFTH